MPEKQTFRERSVDTDILIRTLEKLEIGDVISWDELSEKIGRDVRGSAKGNLITARRAMQNEHNRVFGVIRGEGLKRLDDSEIACSGLDTIKRVKRMSTRGIRRMSCVVYEKLGREDRSRFNTDISILGALSHLSKRTSVRRLESRVQTAQERLAVAETLKSFVDGDRGKSS